jgi:sugar phosphate isomerase/epimerase
MEDPLETARAFAPWTFTVHLKDQAVRQYDGGYWLADVALGEGFLDLPAIVRVLREAKPDIKFNLETITRDPIRVPMLTDGFWATMRDTPAKELARTLRLLKQQAHPKPFPMVSKLPRQEQLALEQRNVKQSLDYARAQLRL